MLLVTIYSDEYRQSIAQGKLLDAIVLRIENDKVLQPLHSPAIPSLSATGSIMWPIPLFVDRTLGVITLFISYP